jgi:molecular chaperone DnaK
MAAAKDLVIGIDLGTSNSCVSILRDGKVEIMLDEEGSNIQPSVVHFQEDGTVMVGRAAKAQMITSSENTVYSSKRLIGRKYFSAEVKKAKAICPYEIIEGQNRSVLIKVRGREYTLQEISAFILKKMKKIAENHLKQEVRKAVVTVPAYFNDNQRAATKDAGRIAGLDVLRIINEPTAAALAYGYGKNLKQRVAVYDLGGGTFDISVLELGEGIYEVISTSGDTYLGGDDFDDRIIDFLAEHFVSKTNFDPRTNKMMLQQLKDAAERAKIELTSKPEVNILIPAFHKGSKGTIDLDVTLTRQQFEQMVMDLIQKTFKVCDEAMMMARITPGDLDGVILVGGPTRIPIVFNSVRHYFQQDPQAGVNPDEVVAVGAAIQGSELVSDSQNLVLLDLTPLSMGVEIAGGYIDRIIEINTPIPADNTKIFTTTKDNQESVAIKVYQGESKMAADNEMLGQFTLGGLRKATRGELQIAVTFEIDTNGILNVVAKDMETGTSQVVKLDAAGRLAQEKINELEKNTAKAMK